MRRVLIGTPSYDGRIDVWFADSLIETYKLSKENNVSINVVYLSYDSLIQRARNSLFKIAIEGEYDDLFFIDSDVEWRPEWFYRILEREEPIVGAALVKKSDETEGYTIQLLDSKLKWSSDNKLIEVNGLGTGFMKISKFALEKLWEMSEPYKTDEGDEQRMVCDLIVKDGVLISEDYVICKKWQSLGYKVWIDPTITINHIGIKKFKGDFNSFIKKTGYV